MALDHLVLRVSIFKSHSDHGTSLWLFGIHQNSQPSIRPPAKTWDRMN